MSNTITLDEIVSRAGGNAELGRRLGITSQAISKWISENRIPIERVPAVEEVTGIPRHMIRPDRPDLFPPPKEAVR